MRQQKYGRIVNVSSASGLYGNEGVRPYLLLSFPSFPPSSLPCPWRGDCHAVTSSPPSSPRSEASAHSTPYYPPLPPVSRPPSWTPARKLRGDEDGHCRPQRHIGQGRSTIRCEGTSPSSRPPPSSLSSPSTPSRRLALLSARPLCLLPLYPLFKKRSLALPPPTQHASLFSLPPLPPSPPPCLPALHPPLRSTRSPLLPAPA
jgi:hypothetical protein